MARNTLFGMAFHRRILAVATISLLAALSSIVLSSHTVHAAGCWDHGCDGGDPVAMGCNNDGDTWIRDTIAFGNGTLYLKYSFSCGAAWTSLICPDPLCGADFSRGAVMIQDSRFTDGVFDAAWVNTYDVRSYTLMLGDYSWHDCVQAVAWHQIVPPDDTTRTGCF